MTIAIDLRGVGKRYVKYDDAPMLSRVTRLWQRSVTSDFWALQDIDLQIHRGESVGVMGRNGAGKSTLLSLLCGVTAPTTGRVEVRGTVAPLISVGVGFHPEMTGRENVFVNATILGLSNAEIEQRFDRIVEFAEIERFIDTPVKFYSSGMFVRLGFAVAVEVRPEVLLVDEVLAVGDLPFQIKSFQRMAEIRANGTTVVVVSHNLNTIRAFCDRGIVLNKGALHFDGPTFEAVGAYHELLGIDLDTAEDSAVEAGSLIVTAAELLGVDSRPAHNITSGEDVILRLSVEALQEVVKPVLWTGVRTSGGVAVYSDTNLASPHPALSAGQRVTYDVRLAADLPTGSYTVEAEVHRKGDIAGTTVKLARVAPLAFYVAGRRHVHGTADLRGRFEPGRPS